MPLDQQVRAAPFKFVSSQSASVSFMWRHQSGELQVRTSGRLPVCRLFRGATAHVAYPAEYTPCLDAS